MNKNFISGSIRKSVLGTEGLNLEKNNNEKRIFITLKYQIIIRSYGTFKKSTDLNVFRFYFFTDLFNTVIE